MCDFSLHAVRSRPAKVGDNTTRIFNLGTGGFCAPEDKGMAVCLLPDTDIPGCIVSSTSRIFSAVGQRQRRWTDVITSTRGGEAF